MREQAIEAGWAALDAADADGSIVTLGDVAAVVDAVEPIILADALRQWRAVDDEVRDNMLIEVTNRLHDDVEAEVRERLRAQVEALRAVPPNNSAVGHRFSDDRLVWRSDVLALLDGEPNG